MTVLPRRAVPLVALLVASLAACGGSQKDAGSSAGTIARVPVDIAGTSVQSAGKKVDLTSAQKDAVSIALSRYVTSATATPLQTGQVGRDLSEAFDTGALADATGSGKAALLDDGLPVGKVTFAPVTAKLDAVAGKDGTVAMIAATMNVDAQSSTGKGPIRITRAGTYVLYPEASTWRIHSYDVTVTRETPDGLSTTTSTRK